APLDKIHIASSDSNSITWPMIVNNPHNNTDDPYGVGIKLKQSGNSEIGKWVGIAAVAESDWSNTTGLAFYTSNGTERMRINNGGNVGIGTAAPGYKLEVAGESNIASSGDTDYRIQGKRSIGDYPGWNANMLYINSYGDWTSGVTIAGNGGLSVDGRTSKFSNFYPIYRWKFGGGQDLNWKTIANITIGTGTYTGASFEVEILNAGTNFGASVNAIPLRYFVRATRSGGTQDDFNNAEVSGPIADYVRVVKTATGVYELQARQNQDWLHMEVSVRAISINSLGAGGAISYIDNPSNGSNTGVIYNASSVHTDYFTKGYFSGKVGIGTTAPTEALDVNGKIKATEFCIGASCLSSFAILPTGTSGQTLRHNGTNWIANSVIYNDGTNVGIGTTAPNAQLEIYKSNAGAVTEALRLYNPGGTENTGVKIAFGGGGTYNEKAYIAGFFESGGVGQMALGVHGSEIIRLDENGNVGIGTTNPGANKLKVQGAAEITNDLIIGGALSASGADMAEEFTTEKDIEEGTVVIMGDEGYKSAKPCDSDYDTKVIGVVSDNPAVIMGKVDSAHKAIIAISGVVTVKVNSKNGIIKKGDLLTSSNMEGYAMKAIDAKIGTVIGKALEECDEEKCKIKALINLQ
ncbi:MAG: hypothetical protein V1891_03795, partial [bacterium]